ncbi:MAG TPA: sensor histidine kinase [Armatimonadota bacterium]
MHLPHGQPDNPQPTVRRQGWWRDMPLRRRLVVSSLIGAIPLIIIGIVLLIGRYQALRNQILANNLGFARLVAVYTAGWLQGHERTLRTLALSQDIQSGTLDDMRGLAMRQVRAQPDWDYLWITDAAGREIVNTAVHDGKLAAVGDRDYFLAAKRTRRASVSGIIVGRTTGHRIIAIAYPIITAGRFRGIVAAGIRPSEFQQAFSHVAPEQQMIIALWGRDQHLIARSNTPEEMLGVRFTAPDAGRVLSGESGTAIAISPITNELTLIGYAPVAVAPWTVVTAVPFYTALAPVFRTMLLFVLVSLLVLLASLAWTYYSATLVSRQISLLADSAREIGAGNLATRVTLHAGGELEDLAGSLNKMAADLQVIERLKSDLLSMVSHELKTPLTSIRTSLDILSTGTITAEHPRYREILEIADRQSRRLQDMIENVLVVARLEIGGLAITPRPTQLCSIFMASVRQYSEAAKAKGLQLDVAAPDDLRVRVDAAKLTLALNNLLDNAVKFTAQGSITIRGEAGAEGMATVTVTDTGIGMTDEVRARLFERFYQAEPLLTRKAGGAGLGLFVTRAIIEGHGGHVFAESAGTGHGSTLGFTIPQV